MSEPVTQLSPEALLRDEAQARAQIISSPRYKIALDLTTGDETFASDTTIEFECSKPGSETFLDLTADAVESIELNGEPLDPALHTGYRIPLAGLAKKNTLRVKSTMRYSRSGMGLHRFTDPVDHDVYLYSQFESREAHRAYACFDQPDIKGTFTFTVTSDPTWVVRSNTAPTIDENDERRIHTFGETIPMSTYITAIVAGPYVEFHDTYQGIDLGLYCRKSLAKHLEVDLAEIFETTKQGFAFFDEYFGLPYMWGDKYDQLFCPEFNQGAMENAACVTFNELYIFRSKVIDERRERRAETILHEMAHMWFGDLTTMRWWDDLWLNESFATYMASLSMVAATRWTGYWTRFASAYKAWAMRQDQLPTTHPIVADCPDTETARTNFDGISYAKGASVLKQLVAFVGQDNFRDGCRLYFQRYPYANATLADFLGCQEETSGRDLKSWSAEWLETAGVNTLSPLSTDADGRYTGFSIEQSANAGWPTIRTHRLKIGLFDLKDGKLQRRRQLELDVSGETTDVPELVGEAVADFVLVNDDDLTFAKIRLDPRSLATARDHLGSLDDPLARAIVWAAAIDQLLVVELAARDFVSLVVNNISTETDSGLVTQLLALVGQGIVVFGDPANRDAARLALATRARTELEHAEESSDLQLTWAKSFISNARTADHVAEVKALFDGTLTIGGLAIDTDLRWLLVDALARLGAIDEDIIAAELERDPTDEGQRFAAGARAGRPTAAAKQEAWAIGLDPATAMQTMEAHIGGMMSFDQAELLLPYEEKYFAELAPFWERGPVEAAVEFCQFAFPLALISERLVARIKRYLDENPSAPGPYARYLTERKDLLERALRGRILDAAAS